MPESEQEKSQLRAAPDLTGSTIGRFSITERLGSGGMGEVYRAEDSQLKRTVAIKRLSPRENPERRQRSELLKEAQRASALNHPRIAGIYDIVAEGNELFLVMEYVDGMTLRERLESAISMAEFFDIAVQCLEGLAAAHDKGIMHGDLKPENIMLTRSKSEVKVCDFGLARRVSSSTGIDTGSTIRGGIAGTPAYMAPEVALEQALDIRADIFSLGVVFYEMLTLKNPFRHETFIVTLDRIRNLIPVSVDRLNDSVPPDLALIIARMLEKEPGKRYSNASRVLEDLLNIKVGQASEVKQRRIAARTWVWIVATALALALVLVILRSKPADMPTVQSLPDGLNLTVLPFSSIGADQEKQFFSQGLTETLNAQLSRLTVGRKLQVTTATEARARGVRIPQDARQQFGSNVALSGTLQYSGNNARINFALTDTASGRTLRTETITGDTADPFGVQDRVVSAAVRMIGLELQPDERNGLVRYGTQQPGAYDFYLQGRGYLLNYDRSENIENAIAVFRQALQSDPRFALAYAGLGEAYWRKHEFTKSTVWVEPARAACEGALAIDPNAPEPHSCLGMVLNGIGNYEKAVEQFQIALNREPTNDLLYVGLANAYEKQGRPMDAEQTYRRAIALRPHYWASYSAFAAYSYRVGRYDEAEQMFRQVVNLAPDSFRGYSNLGGVQFVKDEIPDAIASFEKSLAIKLNYQAASNLGTLYYFEGQYQRSADAFGKALSLNQTDEQVWANLGSVLRWTNKPAESEDAYKHARELAEEKLRVNPRNATAQIAVGIYLAELGEQAKALSLIREAVKLQPTETHTLFRLAVFYERLGQRDEALRWLSKAVKNGQTWREVDHSPELKELRQDHRFQQLRNGS